MNYLQFRDYFIDRPVVTIADIRAIQWDFLLGNLQRRRRQERIYQISRWYYSLVRPSHETTSFAIANRIYSPSYVSLESALRYYDLIPEWVFMTTSITSKKTQTLQGDVWTYRYQSVKTSLMRWYQLQWDGLSRFLIASPSKTICDMLYLKHTLNKSDIAELRRDKDQFLQLETIDTLKETAHRFQSNHINKNLSLLLSYRWC